MKLVRRACDTRFGKDHGFASIRSVEDYQDRVPLRDYEAFWKDYWQPVFPRLQGATWPGPVPYLALSSGTTTGATKYIPVTPEMSRANRIAALTALAWLRTTHLDTPLFSGQMFFLGGSTDLQSLSQRPRVLAGDLSGIAAREVSLLLRPFAFPPLEIALESDWDRKLDRLARASVSRPITLVSGVPSWLLVLFERLKKLTGRDRIAEIWPTLSTVVHGGTRFDPYRELFKSEIGSDRVRFLETYPASEGFIAAEDLRFGMLRLIPDHGLFFEFVPVEELAKDRPTRHTVAEIVSGVSYAVVLTTCAGLWSYVLGDTVCFERTDPPLLRFTGRTRQFLSAFGEHLIGEEVEKAVAAAARATHSQVTDFHVGPQFPTTPCAPGRHRYFIEFRKPPGDLTAFTQTLDAALSEVNEDYKAHRLGDLTLLAPEVTAVRRGGFCDWMRSRGRLGGQNKVPRMDNTGELTRQLAGWLHCGA